MFNCDAYTTTHNPILQMPIIQMGKPSKRDGVCRLLIDPETQGTLYKESNNPSEMIGQCITATQNLHMQSKCITGLSLTNNYLSELHPLKMNCSSENNEYLPLG